MTRRTYALVPLTAAVGVLCLCASPARAQVLYGITLNNQLITVNTTTGAGTLVGPLSSNMNPPGLAFRGNALYTWDGTAQRIRQLDPATAATLNTIDIGALGIVGDVTFRSDGIGFLSAAAPISQLVSFDITVPNSTVIGPLNPWMYGLAFAKTGVLYGLSQAIPNTQLYTIDQTTAVTTLVGNTGLPWFPWAGLACDPTSGQLFGALGPAGSPSSLYRIDATTGAATLVGSIGFQKVSGIAFQPVPPPPPLPPPPSGGEGSFAGSQDPQSGSEGSFGSGGHLAVATATGAPALPTLVGPFLDSPAGLVLASSELATSPPASTTMKVFNTASRAPARGGSQAPSVYQGLVWVLFRGLGLAVTVVLARAIVALRANPTSIAQTRSPPAPEI